MRGCVPESTDFVIPLLNNVDCHSSEIYSWAAVEDMRRVVFSKTYKYKYIYVHIETLLLFRWHLLKYTLKC